MRMPTSKLGKLESNLAYQKMHAEGQVRRKNIIAKTRLDRKSIRPARLARRYGAKKNVFFRVAQNIVRRIGFLN